MDDLARTKKLFVVTDFDGTLTTFATDIYAVQVHPDALTALRNLAALPNTTVAVLSGRHLEGLRRVMPLRDPVILGGSHGAETSGTETKLTSDQAKYLARIDAQLNPLVEQHPGSRVEVKPFQRVFHTLGMPDDAASSARAAALALDGAQSGKNVVEFSATTETKGSWISAQRERLAATATVFLGDDVTDEQGFAVLNQPPDLGVKVGEGDTLAQHRVSDPDEVAAFLTDLAAARRSYLEKNS